VARGVVGRDDRAVRGGARDAHPGDLPHPEDGYRKCMALIRTSKTYVAARVDAACARALAIGSPNRKSVEMILKKGLDRAPMRAASDAPQLLLRHENVRGSEYFDQKERT